jgi:transcriptional regulator with XRE-family HTH domain
MSKKRISKKVADESTPGGRVRAIRLALGLNQLQFGNKLGISASMISDIENNNNRPTFDITTKLLKNYNINLSYLFSGEGELFKDKFEIDPKKIAQAVNPKDIEEFLKDFYLSGYVQLDVMSHYRKLKHLDSELIQKDIKAFLEKKT